MCTVHPDNKKEMFGGGGVSCGQVFGQALTVLFAFPFFLAEAVAIYAVMEAVSPLAMVCVVSVIAVNFVFIRIMGAYTHKGRALMDKVEGLKLYLSVAEKDRLEALHSPERTPETFEKFLPYAIALDVENEWAGKFADVLAQASLPVSQGGEGYSPSWYSGDRFIGGRVGAIGGGFASGLGRSMTSAISSASTPPGSSSGDGGGWSSGGGGGGGGGSSGGGGGGGGGGGW